MKNAHRPRKRFGQHFLTDPDVIEQIVAAIRPRKGDVIVEIGPGRGAITNPLARFDAELHLVEFDRDLVALLRKRFASVEHVHVHEADALRFDFAGIGSKLRVVGNLPYNISTPLLFRLIEFQNHLVDMHFMLQKEVVDRMAASPGNKSYGRLSVMLRCSVDVEPLFDVGPASFTPPPKVMSSVVCMRPKPSRAIDPGETDELRRLVTQAFSQRRKTLRNALKGHVSDECLRAVGIDPAMRAEEVPVEVWIRLAKRSSEA